MKFVLGLAGGLLAGCAAVAPAPIDRAAALDGRVWELPDAGAGRPVTLEFSLRDGGALAVGGYDGCNRFNGPAELGQGEAIRFERLAFTRMACLGDTGAIERRVQVALGETRSMRVAGTSLSLLDAGGQTLLVFQRQ
ncbi:MAG: META domain-containing protein [Rubritepida sp.]|nr:META domain-containing protein [Rubritepida sp.]